MTGHESPAMISDLIPTTAEARGSVPFAMSQPVHWYAAYTRANHEKRAHERFLQRSIESVLPTYLSVRIWKDRCVRLQMPLFPGYVFIRISAHERFRALEVPGVAKLVGFGGVPAPLHDQDIACLRVLAQHNLAKPHPYLSVGRRVRVTVGPLRGAEGVLVKRRRNSRVVLSVHLVQRSVIVDIDESNLEPVFGTHATNEVSRVTSWGDPRADFPSRPAHHEEESMPVRVANR
jgi:transcription antitermination factor NusG